MNLGNLLSGTIGVLVGALVGPLVAAAIQARWNHRASLRAVRGEIRANLSVLRAHELSQRDQPNLEQIPSELSTSTEVFDAMASLLATWGEGTVHEVSLHYHWLRQTRGFAASHGIAARDVTVLGAMDYAGIQKIQMVTALFTGLCTTRDSTIRLGVVALEWIENELERMDEWESPRQFNYEDASK